MKRSCLSLLIFMLLLAACGEEVLEAGNDPVPQETATATTTPTNTATPLPTVEPTATVTPSPTPEPSATPSPTPEPTATPSPTPTPAPTATTTPQTPNQTIPTPSPTVPGAPQPTREPAADYLDQIDEQMLRFSFFVYWMLHLENTFWESGDEQPPSTSYLYAAYTEYTRDWQQLAHEASAMTPPEQFRTFHEDYVSALKELTAFRHIYVEDMVSAWTMSEPELEQYDDTAGWWTGFVGVFESMDALPRDALPRTDEFWNDDDAFEAVLRPTPDPHALTIGAGVEWPRGETQVVQHVDATATQVDVHFEVCAALDEPQVVDDELFSLVLEDGTLAPIGTLLPQGSVNEITLQPGKCGAGVIRFQVDKAPYYVLQPDRDIRWRVMESE